MGKKELEESIEFSLDRPYACVTFHPPTMEGAEAASQIREVLMALEAFPEMKFILTKANADSGGQEINEIMDRYAKEHENWKCFPSLGARRYLSALKYGEMVIGNSSSGLIEAPSFHVPTINIGDRQKGRIRADSVIDCLPEKKDILRAMERAEDTRFRKELANMNNPYGDGETSDKIIKILETWLLGAEVDLKKRFYDMV